MNNFELWHRDDPPLVGDIMIDQLRFIQVAANRFRTLEERREYALDRAADVNTTPLRAAVWDIGTDQLIGRGLEIENDSWGVIQQDLDLLAKAKKVTYVYGADVPEDSLAIVLSWMRPLTNDPEVVQRAARDEDVFKLGTFACTPILHIQSWRKAKELQPPNAHHF